MQDAIERGWFRKNLSLAGEPDMLAIISTAQEVIAALAYMHERDLIHGDVRGANIMLCSSTADQRGFTAQVRTKPRQPFPSSYCVHLSVISFSTGWTGWHDSIQSPAVLERVKLTATVIHESCCALQWGSVGQGNCLVHATLCDLKQCMLRN